MKIIKLLLPSIIMIAILSWVSTIMSTHLFFRISFPITMYITLSSAIDGGFIDDNCDGYFLIAILCWIFDKMDKKGR